MQKLFILMAAALLLVIVWLIWQIRQVDVPSPTAELAEYEAALGRTAGTAPPAGGRAEKDGIRAIREYFADITVESVRARTREVYAADAFFNDTLKTLRGAEAIEEYFVQTARNAESVKVEFVDVVRSDTDYYLRWRMTMRVPALKDGEPLVSAGVTHFRLDADGRVLVHKDFWDAAGGLYEHIPVLGAIIRYARSRL